MPADTPMVWRLVTGLAYLAVLGLAMAGLQTLRRREAQMARLITQDPLTTVLNARAFADRLGQELDRNRRYPRALALMYMDLDNFKVINDTHGHQTGDAVLRLVASLRNVFKGTPNVTASIGVVSCTATDASTDDLLRRADQAMYDAKKSGKDRVVQVAILSCCSSRSSARKIPVRTSTIVSPSLQIGPRISSSCKSRIRPVT